MFCLQKKFARSFLPIEDYPANGRVDWQSSKIVRLPVSQRLIREPAILIRRRGNESRHDELHLAGEWPIPPVDVIGLPNGTARAVDHGVAIASADNVVMGDFSWFPYHNSPEPSEIEEPDRNRVVLDRPLFVISLSWINAVHYSHWMQQAFPVLLSIRYLGLSCYVGVRRITRKQREMLRFMGFETNDIIDLDDGQIYTAPLVLSSNNQIPILAPEQYDVFDELSARIADDGSNYPRIYISRRDETERLIGGDDTLGYRMLWNEPELIARLTRLGFISVVPSLNPLETNVNLFRKASVIVGCHGAGLTDIVFARRRAATVVALLDPDYHYWGPHNAAAARELPLYLVFGENFYSPGRGAHKDTHNNFVVDIDLVEQAIANAGAHKDISSRSAYAGTLS